MSHLVCHTGSSQRHLCRVSILQDRETGNQSSITRCHQNSIGCFAFTCAKRIYLCESENRQTALRCQEIPHPCLQETWSAPLHTSSLAASSHNRTFRVHQWGPRPGETNHRLVQYEYDRPIRTYRSSCHSRLPRNQSRTPRTPTCVTLV